MKRLFKRREQEKPSTAGLYALFGGRINKLLHRWADWLQGKTERLTDTGKKVVLALFICLFGGCSLYVGLKAILNKNSSVVNIGDSVPDVSWRPTDAVPSVRSVGKISDKEFEVIRSFHRYLDSLRQTDSGRNRVDSLLNARPGLVDSLATIERIYLKGKG